jgi:hypothetical protein
LPPGQYAVALWYWGLDEGSGMEFYPDNAHPRFFEVQTGAEYTGIDFTVVPQPSSQIAGRVEVPEGAKGPVQLALGIPDQPVLPLSQVVSEPDGTFHFGKVPVGTYDLFAAGPATGHGVYESILDESAHLTSASNASRSRDRISKISSYPSAPRKALISCCAADNADGCPATANVYANPLEPWAILPQSNVLADFRQPRTIANLTPGKVRLTANGLGNTCFQMNEAVADLTGDRPPLFEIKLAGAGSIHGTMHSAAAGSRILLIPVVADNNQQCSAYTDAQGRFRI